MSKRELVFNVFDGKKAERIPLGFWFHFAPESFFAHPQEVIDKNIAGHQNYFDKFHPDFLKLMSDGYFLYPNATASNVKTPEDLDNVVASNPTEWIDGQVALVKELTKRFKSEVATFYNIFSPTTYFEFLLELNKSHLTLAQLAEKNPKGLKHAISEIGKDIELLSTKVITEGGADGIYLSVKNIQGSSLTKADYLDIVGATEKKILAAVKKVSDYNILHICGYEGARNDLSTYVDYDVKVVNFAVNVEKESLAEGKKLFGGRTLIGGFDNTANGILYKGTKEAIQAETKRILDEAGTTQGIVLGADCTVPADINFEHLEWVREAANNYAK